MTEASCNLPAGYVQTSTS